MTVVDARGMRCPWPALRLARALRQEEGEVALLADDPAAERECAAVARAADRDFRLVAPSRFQVGARPCVNASFTRQP
jgi:tRNA 2-thiouridine synthesizing protein A